LKIKINRNKTVNNIPKKNKKSFLLVNMNFLYKKFKKRLLSTKLGFANTPINGNIEAIPAASNNELIITKPNI
jgi:hypothetical protein